MDKHIYIKKLKFGKDIFLQSGNTIKFGNSEVIFLGGKRTITYTKSRADGYECFFRDSSTIIGKTKGFQNIKLLKKDGWANMENMFFVLRIHYIEKLKIQYFEIFFRR